MVGIRDMMNVSTIPQLPGPLVTISLIGDPAREDWQSELYRNELHHVKQALHAAGVRRVSRVDSMHRSEDLSSRQPGSVTIEIETLGSAGLAVIKAWMQARFGRKIRIKASDIEVYASTPHEAEHSLNTIRTFSGGYDETV